jgi:hypothetical protein
VTAEFYYGDGRPFMIDGRHAKISGIKELPDYLFIPMLEKGRVVLNRFSRLAVSTDQLQAEQIGLYWLSKQREYDQPGGHA